MFPSPANPIFGFKLRPPPTPNWTGHCARHPANRWCHQVPELTTIPSRLLSMTVWLPVGYSQGPAALYPLCDSQTHCKVAAKIEPDPRSSTAKPLPQFLPFPMSG